MTYETLLEALSGAIRERIVKREEELVTLGRMLATAAALEPPTLQELHLRARISSLSTQIKRLVTALDCVVDAAAAGAR